MATEKWSSSIILGNDKRHLCGPKGILSFSWQGNGNIFVVDGYEKEALCKKPRISKQPILGFSKEDKEGTIQSHDNVLVVTL